MVSFTSSLSRCTASTRWLFRRVAVITPPFPLQEAARCQLSASSSRSRSGPTSSVCADSLVRGLLGGRKLRFIMVFPPSPGMANRKIELDRRAYEQYSDLTAKKMTVGWTYGRLMVASLPRGQDCFRTGPCLLRCAAPAAGVVFCTTWVRTSASSFP